MKLKLFHNLSLNGMNELCYKTYSGVFPIHLIQTSWKIPQSVFCNIAALHSRQKRLAIFPKNIKKIWLFFARIPNNRKLPVIDLGFGSVIFLG